MADFTTVSALRPDTSGHNLVVKVLDQKAVVERPGRPGSKPQKITEVLVGDETAVIFFSARNEEQAELLKAGTYVTLRNAKVDMVRSNMRLAVTGAGTIEAADGAAFEPKTDFNMSALEFELVPVPDAGKGASGAAVAKEEGSGAAAEGEEAT